MARFAGGRNFSFNMVRIGRVVEFRLMASHTRVRRIIVIVVVASGAILCNQRMTARQRVIGIMDRKSGGLPALAGCMTISAACGNIGSDMVGVGRSIILCLVT